MKVQMANTLPTGECSAAHWKPLAPPELLVQICLFGHVSNVVPWVSVEALLEPLLVQNMRCHPNGPANYEQAV